MGQVRAVSQAKPAISPDNYAYPKPTEKALTVKELDALVPKQVGAEICIITPQVAQHILDNYNTRNRRMIENRVKQYADVMSRGGWQFTGENIIFSKDGILNTGQHRLKAITIYGKPLRLSVMFGVETDAFTVTDTGRAHFRTPRGHHRSVLDAAKSLKKI